ncbi:MAG: FCSD flavin-binding domain-containing protein [Burkholderiaceae bacterium]
MNPIQLSRREVLKLIAAGSALPALSSCASMEDRKPIGRVVVVGAGYGGLTAAKYLRMWSDNTIEVSLVDPNEAFVSCPLSNLVLGGSRTLADLTVSYSGLDKYGIKRVRDSVAAIDSDKKQVRLASGATLPFDRVIVSPGVEFMYDKLAGWNAGAASTVLHAWKVGPQTVALRKQLTDMADGGVVIMSIPLAPYRCPPGPYERACQIAWYLKQAKPRSKLIVLDANPDYVSKKPLFSRVFGEDYKGIVDYRVNAGVGEIDPKTSTLVTDVGDRVRGDVINYIPPQRAADIARDTGLITANNRWCEVNWTSMESIKVPGAHVLGDATLSAPAMPKSGHMANQHGKAAAAAIVELMNGRAVVPSMMANTCYSFIDDKNAVHVCSVHRWVAEKKTLEAVPGSGGISSQDRASWALEGAYANGWAQTIWADMLA